MELQFTLGSEMHVVQVEPAGAGYSVTINGHTYTVTAAATPGRPGELALTLDGARHLAWVAADGSRRWVALQGNASRPLILAVPEARGRQRRSSAGQAGALEAQMPGVVRRVLVAAGEAVERGQALLLLEAMKMEIRVSAPQAGVVQQVEVTEGEAVERGQSLVTLVSREQSE